MQTLLFDLLGPTSYVAKVASGGGKFLAVMGRRCVAG